MRDFDPAIGEYIQPDPIGPAGGINPYAYANGNPANNIDSSGSAPPGRTGTPTFPTLIPPNIAIPGSPGPDFSTGADAHISTSQFFRARIPYPAAELPILCHA